MAANGTRERSLSALRPAGLPGAVAALAGAVLLISAAPASAAEPPLGPTRVVARFDGAAGQTPENFAVEPDGSVDVTLVGTRQVARVDTRGRHRSLATLPAPPDGGKNTPLAGYPVVGGIVRTPDGTLLVAYAAGDPRYSGIWAVRAGTAPRQLVSLPAASFANGIALDARARTLYVADSALGRVWQVGLTGRPVARVWATGPALARTSFAGANGLKVHKGSVWVTNTDAATLLQYPIAPGARAGRVVVRARDLVNVDDFDFVGRDDEVLAALAASNRVVLVHADGSHRTVLREEDGLHDPVGVIVSRSRVIVASSGREPGTQANLLVSRLTVHHAVIKGQ